MTHFPEFGSRSFLSIVASLIVASAISLSHDALAFPPPQPDFASQLPRVPPLAFADAMASFDVRAPFRLELVAAEPMINDPVAVASDERLRMFVVEMRDYSEDKEGHLGQVRMLEDTDGDGKYDKVAVFADKLSWPTAIACWDGGVFVGAAPDIWYLRDTDGDGVADERRVVYTGFGKHNVQGLLNSFHWGPDQRIHGSSSTCGGVITRPDRPNEPGLNLNGRDFAFDPRMMRLDATSGGGQHGMSFDDEGRKFVSANSDHLQQVMFEEQRVARNPLLAAPGPRVSIAADGPQAEVFRRSPVERWREIRTELRVTGKAPGPIEGGGRAAGYFTGATGVTIYRGDAWPKEYHGLAIVGDVGSNIVHRKRLEPHGLEFIGRRIDEKSELVASTDIWFRPAQFANAPDGSLYILDVYREVIEHPDSLPPEIKRHLDLTSGNDRGRIYRVIPEGFEQPRVIRPADLSSQELVALLAHPNGWHRDTAARLLHERQDASIVPDLERAVRQPRGEHDAAIAAAVLAGMNALSDETLAIAIEHDEWQAMRWCAGRTLSPAILQAIRGAAARAKPAMDYEVAFALADMPLKDRVDLAVLLAKRYPEDRWQRLALQSSLYVGAGAVAAALIQSAGDENALPPVRFLESLVDQIGRDPRAADRETLVAALASMPPSARGPLAAVVDRYCAAMVAREGGTPRLSAVRDAHLKTLLSEHLQASRRLAEDETLDAKERAAGLRALYWLDWSEIKELAISTLGSRSPQALQTAAIELIGRMEDPAGAEGILENWSGLGPSARLAALETLCARAQYADILLKAIERGEFESRQLDPARVRMLVEHSDAKIRERAKSLLSSLAPSPRGEVYERSKNALEISADAERGRAAFRKVCAACHRLDGVGNELGPNLAAMRARGPDAILVNVIDPNREVNPQFINYIANTTDGRSITGIMASETATSVTLRRGEGAEDTVLRSDIDEIASTGMSLMPEGLEQQLDQQTMADVIAYLMLTR